MSGDPVIEKWNVKGELAWSARRPGTLRPLGIGWSQEGATADLIRQERGKIAPPAAGQQSPRSMVASRTDRPRGYKR